MIFMSKKYTVAFLFIMFYVSFFVFLSFASQLLEANSDVPLSKKPLKASKKIKIDVGKSAKKRSGTANSFYDTYVLPIGDKFLMKKRGKMYVLDCEGNVVEQFSPDGDKAKILSISKNLKFYATSIVDDPEVYWDYDVRFHSENGKILWEIKDAVRYPNISPTGDTVVMMPGEGVSDTHFYSKNGKLLNVFNELLHSIVFSDDGKYILGCCVDHQNNKDKGGSSVVIFDKKGNIQAYAGIEGHYYHDIIINPTGNGVLAKSFIDESNIAFNDPKYYFDYYDINGTLIWSIPSRSRVDTNKMVFSKNGKYVGLINDVELKIVREYSGEVLYEYELKYLCSDEKKFNYHYRNYIAVEDNGMKASFDYYCANDKRFPSRDFTHFVAVVNSDKKEEVLIEELPIIKVEENERIVWEPIHLEGHFVDDNSLCLIENYSKNEEMLNIRNYDVSE